MTPRGGLRARGAVTCAAVCALVLAGCGYRFTAGPGSLPEHLRSVRAPVFLNRSSEPNAEALFTQAFREQLVRTGSAARAGEAGASQVDGEIQSVAFSQSLIGTYRVAVAVQLTLTKDGRVLASTQVSDAEEYVRERDPVTTEANRQAAMRRLADAMMREGYERLASAW